MFLFNHLYFSEQVTLYLKEKKNLTLVVLLNVCIKSSLSTAKKAKWFNIVVSALYTCNRTPKGTCFSILIYKTYSSICP